MEAYVRHSKYFADFKAFRDFEPRNDSILPKNSTHLERSMEKAMKAMIGSQSFNFSAIMNPDLMDSSNRDILMPYLAWMLGVEIWSDEFNDEQKKNLIKRYLTIRYARGTLYAIKEMYDIIGVKVVITENPVTARCPNGEPYKFNIRITNHNISEQLKNEIRRLMERLKPIRCDYLIEIDILMENRLVFGMTYRPKGNLIGSGSV